MKQHIDKSQLMAKGRLLDKFASFETNFQKRYDRLFKQGYSNPKMLDKKTNELIDLLCEYFTIGKMIEILNNDYGYVEILKEQNEADGVVWWATCNRNEYYGYELVDALWQALCYVLEEENDL